MKALLKSLSWLWWWVWVRITFFHCVNKAVDVELEQEMIHGRDVDSDLEVHMLRHEIHVRWGWGDPPTPVARYLGMVAEKAAASHE